MDLSPLEKAANFLVVAGITYAALMIGYNVWRLWNELHILALGNG